MPGRAGGMRSAPCEAQEAICTILLSPRGLHPVRRKAVPPAHAIFLSPCHPPPGGVLSAERLAVPCDASRRGCGQWTGANSICACFYCTYTCTLKTDTQLGFIPAQVRMWSPAGRAPAGVVYCVLHAGIASLLVVEQTSE